MEFTPINITDFQNWFQILAFALIWAATEFAKWNAKKKTSSEKELKQDEEIRLLKVGLKRLEYLSARNHENTQEVITRIYSEYKALGGNSWIDEDYANYLKDKQ